MHIIIPIDIFKNEYMCMCLSLLYFVVDIHEYVYALQLKQHFANYSIEIWNIGEYIDVGR